MLLSLQDAAARLGKSVRQIRYILQRGVIKATKLAGRWLIELGDVPKTTGQSRAQARKEQRLRGAIERGLGVIGDPAAPARYSVRDLRAFQTALPLDQRASKALGGASR